MLNTTEPARHPCLTLFWSPWLESLSEHVNKRNGIKLLLSDSTKQLSLWAQKESSTLSLRVACSDAWDLAQESCLCLQGRSQAWIHVSENMNCQAASQFRPPGPCRSGVRCAVPEPFTFRLHHPMVFGCITEPHILNAKDTGGKYKIPIFYQDWTTHTQNIKKTAQTYWRIIMKS